MWRVSGLPDVAVKGAGRIWNGFPLSSLFQSHSYLELCEGVNCIGGGILCSLGSVEVGVSTHMLYYTYCLGSSVQIPQRKNNLPALFSHSHEGF